MTAAVIATTIAAACMLWPSLFIPMTVLMCVCVRLPVCPPLSRHKMTLMFGSCSLCFDLHCSGAATAIREKILSLTLL